jgi:hypothetical protein
MDEASFKPNRSFGDQRDVGSRNLLSYVVGLHEALKIEIPEAARLSTLDGAIVYVAASVDASETIGPGFVRRRNGATDCEVVCVPQPGRCRSIMAKVRRLRAQPRTEE